MDDARNTPQTQSRQALRAQREAAGITAAYIRERSNRRTPRTPRPSHGPPRQQLPQPIRASLEGGTR